MTESLEIQQTGWDNILPQHYDKAVSEAFVKALLKPLEMAAKAAQQLFDALDMDQATGERLDRIGSIVGLSRVVPEGVFLAYFGFDSQPATTGFGKARMRREGDPMAQSYTLPDAEYRSLIRAKIALNNGHGTSPELRNALMQAFSTPMVSVRDQPNVPATARAWIGRLVTEAEVLSALIPRLLPRLGGVKLEFLFYDPDRVFAFSGQPGAAGFGVGVMFRTALTPVTPF